MYSEDAQKEIEIKFKKFVEELDETYGPENTILYFIDFGFSKEFLEKNGFSDDDIDFITSERK